MGGNIILMIFTIIAGGRDFKNSDMGMRKVIPKNEMKMFVDVRLFWYD